MSKKDQKSDDKSVSLQRQVLAQVDSAPVVQLLNAVTQLAATFDQKAFAPAKIDEIRHFFSNDNLARNNLFEKFKKIAKTPNKINIGICIGEAHFTSIAPELNGFVDGMIFLDINPLFFRHYQLMLDCLKSAKDIEEFEAKYLLGMQRQFQVPEDAGSELLFAFQQKLVGGEFFFLSSEERFQQCKASVEKMPIAYYCADFLNLDHLKNLLAILASHNAHVSFLNITNLLQWDQTAGNLKSQAALELFKPFRPWVLHSFSYDDYPEEGCMAFLEQTLAVSELRHTVKKSTPDLTPKPFDVDTALQRVRQMNKVVDVLYASDPNFDPLQFIKAMQFAILQQQPMLSLQDKGRAMKAVVGDDAKRNAAAHAMPNIFAAAAPQPQVAGSAEPLDEFFVNTFK